MESGGVNAVYVYVEQTIEEAMASLLAWPGDWSIHRYGTGEFHIRLSLQRGVHEVVRMPKWDYWDGRDKSLPTAIHKALSSAVITETSP